MLELATLGGHVPADGVKLVGLEESVPGHDDVSVELVIYGLLGSFFIYFASLVTLLVVASIQLLFDQSKAVVDRQILRNIIDDQVQSPLEDPRRGKVAWPRLHVVDRLGQTWNEEPRVAAYLAQLCITHLCFYDAVNEAKSNGVVLHSHGIQVRQVELRNALDHHYELAAEVFLVSFELDQFLARGCREKIVSNAYVVHENVFKDVSMGAQDFILLEGLKSIVSFKGCLFSRWLLGLLIWNRFRKSMSVFGTLNNVRSIAWHKGNIIVVNNTFVSALDLEVVCDQLDGASSGVV